MSGSGPRCSAVLVFALMALAALALPMQDSEPIHLHQGDAPAFYNGDCPLAALAAFQGPAPLPAPPSPTSTTLVSTTAPLHASRSGGALLVGHTDPRAPPLC